MAVVVSKIAGIGSDNTIDPDISGTPRIGVPKTGQTTDRTPAGRTCKDDGGQQAGYDHKFLILSAGQYSGTTNITVSAETEAHSNNCVLDGSTGLMWSRYVSGSVFGTGAQDLLWDDTGGTDDDIFEYCDQANAGSLAGHSDWRVPNVNECISIMDQEGAGYPVDPPFDSFNSANSWSSTTSTVAANALRMNWSNGLISTGVKTTTRYPVLLVRG